MSANLQEIVCCLGQPVAGNPTQFMMERAFAAAGLDWRYLTLEVSPEALPDAVRGMKALGFRGGNLTIPHKIAVIPLLDQLTEAAELIGAVNTIHRVEDQFVGENTDGKGFVQSLREILDPQGKRVVILGAGGAARAIAVELGLAGTSEIAIVNRTEPRGVSLVETLNSRAKISSQFVKLSGDYSIDPTADIFVNATSIGMGDANARLPVRTASLRPGLVVADVIFNPARTRLLREAGDHGCQTLDGLGMLVNQAVIAFKIWTGVDPDANLMREALEEYLAV